MGDAEGILVTHFCMTCVRLSMNSVVGLVFTSRVRVELKWRSCGVSPSSDWASDGANSCSDWKGTTQLVYLSVVFDILITLLY